MVKTTRAAPKRPISTRKINALLVEESVSTWLPPTVGVVLLAGAILLVTLGVLSEPVAALVAISALLILGVCMVLGPMLHGTHAPKLKPGILIVTAVVWVSIFLTLFALRLFPGAPIATTPLEIQRVGKILPVGGGVLDLLLDAHLPMSMEHQTRQLHYALTLTDGAGQPYRYEGELGDRWQTRRMGRRGTVPLHLEHLSTTHEVNNPSGGTLRLDEVTLSGVPNATLAASFYHHRVPGFVWVLSGGILLVLGTLAFDLWWDPQRTPTAALLTATATGAVLVFCSSAAGHPGMRQVFGSTIVGGIGAVPTVGITAWLARRSPLIRALTSRRTSQT